MDELKIILLLGIVLAINTACMVEDKLSKRSDSNEYREMAIQADKGCQWVAKTVKWTNPEQQEQNHSFQLVVDGFQINVPPNIKRLSLQNNGDLFIYYQDKSVLILSTELLLSSFWTADRWDFRDDKIKMKDIADVMFMKTHCDPVPKNINDALRWNFALLNKSMYFEKQVSVTKTQSGKLTYYLSDSDSQPKMSGRAIVTHDEYKHSVVGLNAFNIPFDKFKQIVFSVRESTKLY